MSALNTLPSATGILNALVASHLDALRIPIGASRTARTRTGAAPLHDVWLKEEVSSANWGSIRREMVGKVASRNFYLVLVVELFEEGIASFDRVEDIIITGVKVVGIQAGESESAEEEKGD